MSVRPDRSIESYLIDPNLCMYMVSLRHTLKLVMEFHKVLSWAQYFFLKKIGFVFYIIYGSLRLYY